MTKSSVLKKFAPESDIPNAINQVLLKSNFIKETFVKDYNLREMALIPVKSTAVDIDLAPGEIKFESVDQIVASQLTAIQSDTYDPKVLLAIYNNL